MALETNNHSELNEIISIVPLFQDFDDVTHRQVEESEVLETHTTSTTTSPWKRYEARTGWTSQGFGDVKSGLQESYLQRKKFHGNCLKAKSSRRQERLRAQCPYDSSMRSPKAITSVKDLGLCRSNESSVLDKYPPRKQISVLDALESLETMKLSKRIGFANNHEIIH